MSKNSNTGANQAALDSPYDNDTGYDVQPDARVSGGKVHPVPISAFGDISKSKAVLAPSLPQVQTLARMLDVPITLVFEVGRTKINIAHLMELREGSYIDLRNVSVDVIDVRVNDNIIAEAEAISLQQRYGMRIAEIEKIMDEEDGDNNV